MTDVDIEYIFYCLIEFLPEESQALWFIVYHAFTIYLCYWIL